jgi:hypothetical protein
MHRQYRINPLNAQLNPICHLLALLGAHHILHVSRIGIKEFDYCKLYHRIKVLLHICRKELERSPAVGPLGLPKQEECHSECNDVMCGATEENTVTTQVTVEIICYKIII